jgi:hypothetical protein
VYAQRQKRSVEVIGYAHATKPKAIGAWSADGAGRKLVAYGHPQG